MLGKLKLQKLHNDAITPSIGSEKSACLDLYALEDVEFEPGEIKLVRTGWAIEPPPGYRLNIYVRSSTPLKKNFILANSVGIIDEDYRGECMVQLMNVNVSPMIRRILINGSWRGENEALNYSTLIRNKISKGDKIAQIELVVSNPATNFGLEIVDNLSTTARGDKGFGSTGN